jgi:predicted ATPase
LYGQDLGVISRAQGAVAPWLLGYPDQALHRAHDALTLAQNLAYPFSIAFASLFVAVLHQLRRESQAALAQAESAVGFTREQGFPFWLAMATITHGGELANRGNGQAGIRQMHQGLAALRALGADIGSTYWVGLLAEKYGKNGRAAEGLAVLAEAFTLVEKNGERWWEAELYRLRGELLLKAAGSRRQAERQTKTTKRGLAPIPQSSLTMQRSAEAEACFQKAIELARQQHAKSLELRAVISLARLWRQQGKKQQARRMLADIYGWFTEGFATQDLQEAKALIEELA